MRYLLSHAVTHGAERHPDHPAIRYSEQNLTYSELERRSNSLANTLIELGLQRGERVGISL